MWEQQVTHRSLELGPIKITGTDDNYYFIRVGDEFELNKNVYPVKSIDQATIYQVCTCTLIKDGLTIDCNLIQLSYNAMFERVMEYLKLGNHNILLAQII